MIPIGRLKKLVFIGFFFSVVLPISNVQAELKIDTSLSVSEQYTDNLFFSFANKREDFGTIITPGATLTFSNKYVTLSGTYSASAQFYVNNDRANTVSHGSNFDIDLPFLNRKFKNLEVRVNESFNLTPEQPGFSGNSSQFNSVGGPFGAGAAGTAGAAGAGAAGAGGAGVGGLGANGGLAGNSLNNQGIFNARGTTSFQNRARIRVGYKFSPRWDANVQYSNTFRGGFQESMTHGAQTGLSFNFTESTRVNGSYNLRIIDFSGSGGGANPQAPGGNGTATSHSLNLGVDHKLTSTVIINATGGVSITKTVVGAKQLNFNGSGSISKNFSDGQISLRVNQQIGAGGGVAASTTLNQNVVLTGSKTITKYIGGFLHFAYGRNRSLAGTTVATDTYQFRGGANVRILEWLTGGVTYSYRNQDSSGLFGLTAQSNSVFVGLTATPDSFEIFK